MSEGIPSNSRKRTEQFPTNEYTLQAMQTKIADAKAEIEKRGGNLDSILNTCNLDTAQLADGAFIESLDTKQRALLSQLLVDLTMNVDDKKATKDILTELMKGVVG